MKKKIKKSEHDSDQATMYTSNYSATTVGKKII